MEERCKPKMLLRNSRGTLPQVVEHGGTYSFHTEGNENNRFDKSRDNIDPTLVEQIRTLSTAAEGQTLTAEQQTQFDELYQKIKPGKSPEPEIK